MGRRDLTEQRTAEILDAFERCVASYGLAGTSLETIAEEAGVKRSILRHYVGNRDDMVEALARRVMARHCQDLDELAANLPTRGRMEELLAFLFPRNNKHDVQSMLVVEALIAASTDFPICQELVTDYIDRLVCMISGELQREYRKAPKSSCWAVAYGIVGICFNNESLVPLALPKKYGAASRECAERLAASLA